MYRLVERQKHVAQVVFWAALMLLVGVVSCAAAYRFVPAKPISAHLSKPAARPYAVEATSNTLFFGNAYFSRYIHDHAMASPLKYAYPFSRLSEFHRENYDAWMTGLECPTVAGFQQTSAQEDATLSFNCSPDYLPEMAKWFNVVTLANNHTDNRGAEGFIETKKHLDENKIQYFGHYDPRELADICDVIALPTTIQTSNHKTQKGSLPVAMCGYHWFIRMAQPDSLAVMKEYSQYMPVLAFPHGGTEYKTAADELKTTLYRSMIDNGADVVLGDHPHVVQPSEAYKGHPIFYSMGNFIFDQQVAPEMTRSAGIHIVFDVKGADKTQLAKWLALGKTCESYHDTCLAQAKKQGLKKLPYTYTFDIVGTDDLGYITKPASAQVQQGILDRLDWSKTKLQLQVPYAAL